MAVTQQNGKLVGRSTEKRLREEADVSKREGSNDKCDWRKANPQQELWAKLSQSRARIKALHQESLNTSKVVVDLTKRIASLTDQLKEAISEAAAIRSQNLELRSKLTQKELVEMDADSGYIQELAGLEEGLTLTDNTKQWGIESDVSGWFVVTPKKPDTGKAVE
jgi:chromosome segregation ATPase